MSFSFSKEAIEDLKSRIDIVDVIGRQVQLKRAGANYKDFVRSITKRHLPLSYLLRNRYLPVSADAALQVMWYLL